MGLTAANCRCYVRLLQSTCERRNCWRVELSIAAKHTYALMPIDITYCCRAVPPRRQNKYSSAGQNKYSILVPYVHVSARIYQLYIHICMIIDLLSKPHTLMPARGFQTLFLMSRTRVRPPPHLNSLASYGLDPFVVKLLKSGAEGAPEFDVFDVKQRWPSGYEAIKIWCGGRTRVGCF